MLDVMVMGRSNGFTKLFSYAAKEFGSAKNNFR